MKKIRLTESELVSFVKKIISESSLGSGMLKNLYDRLDGKYPNVKYDEGSKDFEPYIYIPLSKGKKHGLLIEVDANDNFELHYDNGLEDRPWRGWRKQVGKLNSLKHALTAIDLFMSKHK